VKLFGPVLLYDLIRTARRSRYFILRCVYALVLLILMYLAYEAHFPRRRGSGPRPQDLSAFAEHFFAIFMITQYIVILLLTPAYVAGAIADEKQRRTIEFLLATDLHNQEIVLGKLVSRLAHLTLTLLVGVPILSLTLLFGGVSPDLLAGGLIATVLTMLSVSGISILLSVHGRRPRDAIMLTYLLIILYFAVWGMLVLGKEVVQEMGGRHSLVSSAYESVFRVYSAGNLFWILIELEQQARATGTYGTRLIELLGSYAIFHGVVFLSGTALAVLRVRRVFLQQASRADVPPARPVRARPHRPIGQHPMLWKELFVEARGRLGWVGKIVAGLVALLCLLPAVIIIGSSIHRHPLSEVMNSYVRTVGTLLACLMLLAIAVRAASSIGGERDRQTLDSLLASPLTNLEILFGKWLGSLASVRWMLVLLGVIWLFGLVTGGLHPLAVPLLLVALAGYGAFMASLGLVFAAGTKTTIRAVMWTVGTALFVGGGHWLCSACCLVAWAFRGPGDEWPFFLGLGLTPPFVLALAAFYHEDLDRGWHTDAGDVVAFSVFGYFAFVVAAFYLWWVAVERFTHTCGRIPGNKRGAEAKHSAAPSLAEPHNK
jgi:ABC-type transport system involved in multi-copper enzyme maturation permease subunit